VKGGCPVGRVHIVTDSTGDIPEALLRKHEITVVPLNVHFGDEAFKDGVDIWANEFYYKLEESSILPKTSQPAPGDFLKVYEELTRGGDSVISVHISSQLSGTLQSATMARQMLPQADITVLDTRSASMGLGLVAVEAAEAAAQGLDKTEILKVVQRAIDNVQILFVVDTLEYLQKNGRIGQASALLGTLLNIKPILTVQDGVVCPVEKARGKGKALDRIFGLLKERYGENPVRFSVVHADRAEEAGQLAERLKNEFSVIDVCIAEIGPVVGVHTGPGALGIMSLPRD
jgi:DegV family protein with EDD domain